MHPSQLVTSTFEAHIDDALRRAQTARLGARRAPHADHVVIRPAGPRDGEALRRLAELDSARVPRGQVLLAEVDGAVVAAVGVTGAQAVADPFRRTADIVELLRMRARQLGTRARRQGMLTGLLRGRALRQRLAAH